MKKRIRFFFATFFISIPGIVFCQTAVPTQGPPAAAPYPKLVVYTCFFVPIVSTNSTTTTWNTSANTFSIGFATGINILTSDRFGFSFDVSPVVTTTKGLSKVNNFIFDPGPIFRFKKGFAIITRMAFETAGRFGESTVFSKVFTPAKKSSLFLSLGIPIRFGNNLPASIGATIFFGVAFK